MTIVDTRAVWGGVDTHLDFHVAAALDHIGGLLGIESFETTEAGYRKLLEWLEGFGVVSRVGVEGTGSYGAGLARFLHGERVEVVEVDRPNRQLRHRKGKSDPTDAVGYVRSVALRDPWEDPTFRARFYLLGGGHVRIIEAAKRQGDCRSGRPASLVWRVRALRKRRTRSCTAPIALALLA